MMAVVVSLVQTKQVQKHIHKLNKTKSQYKQYQTQSIEENVSPKLTHITKPTYYKKKVKTTTVRLKQPKFKLQEPQYKICPSEIVTL
jgi:ABC-type transport system substrate-binding protein